MITTKRKLTAAQDEAAKNADHIRQLKLELTHQRDASTSLAEQAAADAKIIGKLRRQITSHENTTAALEARIAHLEHELNGHLGVEADLRDQLSAARLNASSWASRAGELAEQAAQAQGTNAATADGPAVNALPVATVTAKPATRGSQSNGEPPKARPRTPRVAKRSQAVTGDPGAAK